jgi:hypothetical protein
MRASACPTLRDSRHTAEGSEGLDVAAQEAGHPLVDEEAHEELPRPRQHHHEGDQPYENN